MSTHIIRLHIDEESDTFSPFDPEQKTIFEDVLSYLSEQFRKVRKFKKDD